MFFFNSCQTSERCRFSNDANHRFKSLEEAKLFRYDVRLISSKQFEMKWGKSFYLINLLLFVQLTHVDHQAVNNVK